jgi:hypothetical protein
MSASRIPIHLLGHNAVADRHSSGMANRLSALSATSQSLFVNPMSRNTGENIFEKVSTVEAARIDKHPPSILIAWALVWLWKWLSSKRLLTAGRRTAASMGLLMNVLTHEYRHSLLLFPFDG